MSTPQKRGWLRTPHYLAIDFDLIFVVILRKLLQQLCSLTTTKKLGRAALWLGTLAQLAVLARNQGKQAGHY